MDRVIITQNDSEKLKEVEFAYQFLISNGQMPTLIVKVFPVFRRRQIEETKEVKKVLAKREPLDHYESISNSYIDPVVLALDKLINLSKLDSNVVGFSIMMLEKILASIRKINRVKMERCMVIVKCGIPPSCNFNTIEALVELELQLYIYYPPDRKFLSEDELLLFSENVYKFVTVDTELISKLIREINLEESITKKTRDLLITLINGDKSHLSKLVGSYLNRIEISETPINAVMSITETFDIINKRLSDLKFKNFEMSSFTISTIIRGNELYVEYFGFVNKPIGGSFVLDFHRLNKIIKPKSYTYFIFYFVTCHYCLMNSDNIIDVKFKNEIKSPSSNIMFKFLDGLLLEKMKAAVDNIPDGISYGKVFHCLRLFFNKIINSKEE